MSRIQEQKLLDELETQGFSIESVWDWVNAPTPPEAAPILIKHLQQASDDKLIEGIARALTSKQFGAAVEPLIKKFRTVSNYNVRALGYR